ncbi:hypothetical protein AAC387_Pa02g4758 [Persea americana]
MLLSFCRRKLLLHINVKHHPANTHILQNPLLKSISSLSNSPNKPSLTLSYLIKSCGLSPESALVASKGIEIKTTQKPDSVLELLETYGFSDAQITTLISAVPRLLFADVNKTLKPKVDFFRGLGLSDAYITSLITSDPVILSRGLETQIIPAMNFFRDLLHTNENAIKAFRRCRWMITSHMKNRMQSNIAILKEYGLPDSQVTDIALLRPAVLTQKTDTLMEVVKRVEELGLERTSGLFSMALLAMPSLKKSTWEAKLEMLKGLGWSQSDILEALRRMPIILTYSEKKIRAGMDFYVNTLKWKPSEVASDPILLMFSLEERLIPRSRVWKMLTTKELVDERDLRRMLKVAEKQFLSSYVTKYEKEVPNLMKSYKGELEVQ